MDPLVGESVIVADDTTKVELAVLVPSVEDISCGPSDAVGTVTCFVNDPVASVVAVTVELSGSVMVTVWFGRYPVPETVTVLPTAPLDEETVMLGVTV